MNIADLRVRTLARLCGLALVSSAAASGCAAPETDAQQSAESAPSAMRPRIPMDKSHPAVTAPLDAEPARLVVKFNEGTGVRLRGAQLQSEAGGALPASARVPDMAELDDELARAQSALSARGVALQRLFAQSESRLQELKRRGERRAQRQLADLRLYYQVPADRFASLTEMEEVRDSLNALDSVEVAYIEPKTEPAQVSEPTPDLTGYQGYKDPAPIGIGADYAEDVPGGRGAGVSVIDVENGWNVNHEDLPPLAYQLGTNSQSQSHGTAVLGVIGALDNGFGVTGIAPEAELGYSSEIDADNGGGVPGAILSAAEVLGGGDVILLEVHRPGLATATDCSCSGIQCNYLPVEFWQADFDAIATATANDIVVVEAAGNGSVDLDHPVYSELLARHSRDSGAIMVGASLSTVRTPACFSNHGSRVDVHAWGDQVVTTGGGSPYQHVGESTPNDDYTADFGGTSSASAIVTGAVTAIQGVAINSLNHPLSSAEIRGLFRATGTEQEEGSQQDRPIGPMPDLEEAIGKVLGEESVPVADFAVDCDAQAQCTYQDRSFALFANIDEWHWEFDDGSSSDSPNPTRTYTTFGDHSVTLTVTDTQGNTATTTGVVRLEPMSCTDAQVILLADFESGLDPFTTSGSVTRATGAAYSGSYGARVRGTGSLQTVLDLEGYQDLSFSGRAQGINYQAGEKLYFEICPIINGQCDASRTYRHEVHVGDLGITGYYRHGVAPFADLTGIEQVSVTVGAQASGSFKYARFDDIRAEGRACDPIECMNDGFCDNGLFCDGAESCVDGVCQAGTAPCPGSCDETGNTCGGGGSCGDGSLDAGEACDDGNTMACDGCSDTCAVEECGDGVVECGEECDDGNLTSGDGCSAQCTLESTGGCDQATASLDAHVSAGRAYVESTQDCSSCWFGCNYPSGCATTTSTYYAIGSDEFLGSQGGLDGTLYSTDGGTSWSTTPCGSGCTSDSECDDGQFCNGSEVCVGGSCQSGTPVTCGDGVSCTLDACNEATDACESTADDGACDDGDACTIDSCDLTQGCTHEEDPNCSTCTPNGAACTNDSECCSGDCYGWFNRTCQ